MELVFSGYGVEIYKYNEKFFVRYDSGGIVSQIIEKEITKAESIKAQRSERDAYEVLIERDKRD